MFFIDQLVWYSLVAMFCIYKRMSAVYSDDAGPEIGDPCSSPFRIGSMFVQCLSRHMAACQSDRKDAIHLTIGRGRFACLILVSKYL
jgi:hypothetical protein